MAGSGTVARPGLDDFNLAIAPIRGPAKWSEPVTLSDEVVVLAFKDRRLEKAGDNKNGQSEKVYLRSRSEITSDSEMVNEQRPRSLQSYRRLGE